MPDHLVTITFTKEPDAALLPAERERLKELTDGGVVRAAYLSAERSAAWLVVRGDGPDAVRDTVESLPLYPYMEMRGIVEVRRISPPTDEPDGPNDERVKATAEPG